jgi:hypothetical protein
MNTTKRRLPNQEIKVLWAISAKAPANYAGSTAPNNHDMVGLWRLVLVRVKHPNLLAAYRSVFRFALGISPLNNEQGIMCPTFLHFLTA